MNNPGYGYLLAIGAGPVSVETANTIKKEYNR